MTTFSLNDFAMMAEQAAFHESAHAVIHHFYGHAIDEVAISESGGHCKTKPSEVLVYRDTLRELVRRQLAEQDAIACCAGKAAFDHYGFKAESDENWRASDDYKQAHAIALKLSGNDLLGAQHLMRWFEQTAAKMIAKRWTGGS